MTLSFLIQPSVLDEPSVRWIFSLFRWALQQFDCCAIFYSTPTGGALKRKFIGKSIRWFETVAPAICRPELRLLLYAKALKSNRHFATPLRPR